MNKKTIAQLVSSVNRDRLRRDLFHLSDSPLQFRRVNYTRPGAQDPSLQEADDYLVGELEAAWYAVERRAYEAQAFRCDASKPKAHQYAAPDPGDLWHTVHNLLAHCPGTSQADEWIYVVAHKDSQSWVDSPGALDNVVGTVALLEIARMLSETEPARSIRFLLCNEEHTPWTSANAANEAAERGERIHAVLNLDGLAGKSQADIDAQRMRLATAYTKGVGRERAEFMGEVITRYGIELEHEVHQRDCPNDDDGSFVKAGYDCAIIAIGSWPYADPAYHTEEDTPGRVDIEHLARSTQACLAWVAELASGV